MFSDIPAVIPPAIRAVVNSDGGILTDTETNRIFSLNRVGAIVWRQLETGRNQNEIAEGLVDEFQITQRQALSDVAMFLNELKQQHLVAYDL